MRLDEIFDVNGHRIYEAPTFTQLVALVNRYGEMKGHILGPVADLDVWDAHHLTHYDYVADSGEVEDEWDELPGMSYSFTPEGRDAESEWADMPFVEGGGLRIYFNSDFSLKAVPIKRLREKMQPEKLSEEGRVVKGVNTTTDVGVDEITKQAAKFGFSVSRDGYPPIARTDGKMPIREVAEPGVTGFWYHPQSGASVNVPQKMDHYGVVLQQPAIFGIPKDGIAAAKFDMRKIEKLAKERGWARVSGPGRFGSPMIDVLDIEVAWHTAHWMIKNGLIADTVTVEWGDGWWLDLDERKLRRFLGSKAMARSFAQQNSERNEPYE